MADAVILDVPTAAGEARLKARHKILVFSSFFETELSLFTPLWVKIACRFNSQ